MLLKDREAEPQNYWANTSGNSMVRRFIRKADVVTRSYIEQLLDGGTVCRPVRQELTYNELDSSIENLWSVLFPTGYLTYTGSRSGRDIQLKIPNRENRELFYDLVKQWFEETSRAGLSRIESFCSVFPQGDAE